MCMRKYRLFGVINPVDVFLVLVIIVVVWGATLLAQPQTVIAESGQLVRFTVEIGDRPAGFYQTIELGAPVYCATMGWLIGTIVDVYADHFRRDVPDEAAGIIRRTIVEGLEFTYIVIEAWAEISDYSTSIGEFWVAVNRPVPVVSRDFGGNGLIVNLELVEGAAE